MSEIGASPAETSAPLTLEINGEAHSVPGPCSVRELLGILDLAGKRVAVALNRDVIVRSRYDEVALRSGDHIEILEAVGGG